MVAGAGRETGVYLPEVEAAIVVELMHPVMLLVQKQLKNQVFHQFASNFLRQVDFNELEDMMQFSAIILTEDTGNALQFGEEDNGKGVTLDKDVVCFGQLHEFVVEVHHSSTREGRRKH